MSVQGHIQLIGDIWSQQMSLSEIEFMDMIIFREEKKEEGALVSKKKIFLI